MRGEGQKLNFESACRADMLQSHIGIRHYMPRDRDYVFHLLSFLPKLYPGSFDWLDRRLDEVEQQHALCRLALVHSTVAGILIETPKGVRTSKISTFFVGNQICRRGVGSLLFRSSLARWHTAGIDNVYVTVAGSRQKLLDPFLQSRGFVESAHLPDRYGAGRDELIYSLKLK